MNKRLCCDHVSWAASIGAEGFLERDRKREQAQEKQDEAAQTMGSFMAQVM